MKFCHSCKHEKNENDFSPAQLVKKYGPCRACVTRHSRAYYARNRTKVQAYQRKRLVENATAARKSYQKYKYKDPARQRVRYALKTGKIVKLPCAVCNDTQTRAHHPDYNKPLEVIWLCHPHHKAAHRKYEPICVSK